MSYLTRWTIFFILLFTISNLSGCVTVNESNHPTHQLTKNTSYTYSDDDLDDDDPLRPTLQTKILAITVVTIAVIGVIVTAVVLASVPKIARNVASRMVHA